MDVFGNEVVGNGFEEDRGGGDGGRRREKFVGRRQRLVGKCHENAPGVSWRGGNKIYVLSSDGTRFIWDNYSLNFVGLQTLI